MNGFKEFMLGNKAKIKLASTKEVLDFYKSKQQQIKITREAKDEFLKKQKTITDKKLKCGNQRNKSETYQRKNQYLQRSRIAGTYSERKIHQTLAEISRKKQLAFQ